MDYYNYINIRYNDLKKEEDVFEIIMDIKKKHKELAKEVIAEHIRKIPSIDSFCIFDLNFNDCKDLPRQYHEVIRQTDDKWLNDILTFKIIFWKNTTLLL